MSNKLFEQVASIARNDMERLLDEADDTKKTILGVATELEWTFKNQQSVKLEDVIKEIRAMAERI